MSPSGAFARIFLAALLLGVAARAQEPTLEGDQVEITAERAASLRAPAAESTVVDVARFGGEVRSVSELLATAPGVVVHTSGGPGQLSTVSLRGATADQSLVLLDGIPLQGPGGGAVDLSTVPASILEKLVVSRGVLGARFGAGALGGAVELVPRSARERFTGGALLSAGSFGTAQAALDLATPVGVGATALFAAQFDRTSGDFDFARQTTPELAGSPYYGFTRENADARRGSALLRVTDKLTPATELDVLAQGSMGRRGLPGSSSAPTADARASDGNLLAGARLRGVSGAVGWSVRTWGRLDRVAIEGACGSGCVPGVQRGDAGRFEAELGAPLGSRHWLKGLVSTGVERIRGSATGDYDRATFAASLSDDVALAERVSVHPAIRFDRVGRANGFSPGVSASWRPGPVELRAGWGLSFRPPTFSELYLDSGGISPNPDLEPERAWSVDAGITTRTGLVTVSAGAFWSRVRELVVYELYPPNRLKPFNVSSARIAGVELQAVVSLPFDCTAEATYGFLDAINEAEGPQAGHHLSYRPPHRLFLRLAHRADRLEGYAETSFTSQMPRNQYDTAFIGAQTFVNAGVGARVMGPLWLDVEARNLLDERTAEDLFQYPLPGFSLAVLARARL